jgi:hypothetical protein
MTALRITDEPGYVSPQDKAVWVALARAVIRGQRREALKWARKAAVCQIPPGAYHTGSDYYRLYLGALGAAGPSDLAALANYARVVEAEMAPPERDPPPRRFRADIDG